MELQYEIDKARENGASEVEILRNILGFTDEEIADTLG